MPTYMQTRVDVKLREEAPADADDDGAGATSGDDGAMMRHLLFNPQPGNQMWAVAGAKSSGDATGRLSGEMQMVGYLRARADPSLESNALDPINAIGWEVVVSRAPGDVPQGGEQSIWLAAPGLRLTRGAAGAKLWAAQQAKVAAKLAKKRASKGQTEGDEVWDDELEEMLAKDEL